ncbi:lipopolysaccharide transport system permease protein [Pseudomonas sp. SJZ079]|uniref:ABC transporter permease n=1 Tax=Pseudomonas sp. SJZ079 TaxID=2572887 RepID=UPI00119BF58F|nr:ABC transporter permease [Pseudomonas sp. SJZ079]TWC34964.1 lipopolysaccharide transport system permease protein [Pseudomonas sp. SJZ079]
MQIRNSIELILYKVYTDIKAEAARSYLGLVWWLIEPVLYLCAFYILFVLVLQRGSSDFVPTFLCGAVVWKWFDSGLKGGSHAISTHHGLLQQVYVPKYIFPVIAVLGSTARFFPVFACFAIFLLLYGFPAQVTWLAVPIVMLAQLCLIMALALLVGAITPFLPDLKVAIDNGMLLLFFLSGVFFDINEVQEPVKSYLLLNPMAGLIDEYRNVMIRGVWPDMGRIGLIMLISLVVGGFGLVFLKQMDHRYGKVRF